MWIPYFITDENWQLCKSEMLSWNGTPYRHLKCVKGRGADCTLFIAAVWNEIKVINKITHGYYPRDWHIHTKTEFVKNGLQYHIQHNVYKSFEIIEIDNHEKEGFIRGDMLLFSTLKNGITNHTTIWCGDWDETNEKDQMYNSINHRGVCRLNYGSWWKRRLTGVFRVMKEI